MCICIGFWVCIFRGYELFKERGLFYFGEWIGSIIIVDVFVEVGVWIYFEFNGFVL